MVAPLARMLAPWLLISTKRAVDQLMLAATRPPLQVCLHHEHCDCSTARAFMQCWIGISQLNWQYILLRKAHS